MIIKINFKDLKINWYSIFNFNLRRGENMKKTMIIMIQMLIM